MKRVERFTVTAQHVDLLRRANVSWSDTEFGAPCIDPKRPYGNGDVLGDIASICDVPDPEAEFPDEVEEILQRWHRETETALQIFLATGAMELGTYEAPAYTNRWEKVE